MCTTTWAHAVVRYSYTYVYAHDGHAGQADVLARSLARLAYLVRRGAFTRGISIVPRRFCSIQLELINI